MQGEMSQNNVTTTTPDAIMQLLEDTYPKPYNAGTLAERLDRPESTVRKALQRLHDRGEIVKTSRGFYRAKGDFDRIVSAADYPLQLHNLHISVVTKTPVYPPDVTPGVERQSGPSEGDAEGLYIDGEHREGDNGFETYRVYWMPFWADGGYRVTLQCWPEDDERDRIEYGGNGEVCWQVILKASSDPLGYYDYRSFVERLDGWFGGWGVRFTANNPRITQMELNRDFPQLRLDGIERVTIGDFGDVWFTLYNKGERGLRREAQLKSCFIGLVEALQMLSTPMEVYGGGERQGSLYKRLEGMEERLEERFDALEAGLDDDG